MLVAGWKPGAPALLSYSSGQVLFAADDRLLPGSSGIFSRIYKKRFSFLYLRKVIRKRCISIFLLCLFMLVNWHNALLHAHGSLEGRGNVVVHSPDHGHHHHHHHHQGEQTFSFTDWIKQLLVDYEHADLGDKHLEVFLQPQQQSLSNQFVTLDFPPTIFFLSTIPFSSLEAIARESFIPIGVLAFSDPPFWETTPSRGPPLFS